MSRWKRASVSIALLLPLVAASGAAAITAEELECCDEMDQAVQKYFQKHIKKARKCTIKMDESADPGGERCDDEFDAVTGGTDFLIDKFEDKTLKKMKQKCISKLGLADDAAFNVSAPMPSPCTCNAFPFLPNQVDCKLNLIPGPADGAVCDITPTKKNSNRGTSSPPGTSGFCP
jgi:hypothetical protein